ncbi:guanine nucleotide-binding protein-like 3 homolog [Saccostrea echinata]|uniref:guanine nucleotide-binding protein-like 3 homolog n=1 Tax=Saccostrea echinata TaxID=191078 RepID=UPI002A82B5F4|nr:guanine nucleotide-binding protein-like 3 homolog [Saccostrea echinata]
MPNKKFLNKKSKRVSAARRYKIEKLVRQHNKKAKKEAKKNPNKFVKKRKDPGIPNSLPFKETILREAEEHKRKIEEERERQKERRKREREKLQNKKRNLTSLVKDAEKKTQAYERKKNIGESSLSQFSGGKAVETSLKAYYKEFRKVVDAADVILEVLDARDPLGSRCSQMEDAIISSGTNKKLVLVLNKIDLIPRENVEDWLKYLRNEFPTIAFKASTQTQNENLSQTKVSLKHANEDLLKSSHCIGADLLMKLLGNYCRNQNIKTAIRVGVVGLPNTGKSSLINSLKRSRTCNVGAMPGVTKSMQEVHLDKHIKLLDSPGVVMTASSSDTSVILRNCVKLESLEDPIGPVDAILKRCSREQLMLHFKIPDFKDTSEFLSLLATRQGKLKKGGIPDINKAAKMVLQEWTCGKITYYTHPPEKQTTHISASIVQEMSKEFNIDDILQEENSILEGLNPKTSAHILVDSLGPAKMVTSEEEIKEDEDEDMDEEEGSEEEEEVMEDDDEELKAISDPVKSSRASSRKSSVSNEASQKQSKGKQRAGLRQLNKDRKKDFKKMKKQRKRADKVAGELSDAFTSVFSGQNDENYDFNVLNE